MIRKIFWSKYTVVGAITLLMGLIIGFLLSDFPLIVFDNKLKVYEVFNLFLTLSIAISIPFIVKKSIDDKRAIKALLSEEVKSVINNLSLIKDLIVKCNINGTITREDKDDIIRLFNNLELQINSLNEQLDISFKTQSKNMINEIKEEYFTYDRFVTNDDLMCETCNAIDAGFYREHKAQYSRLEVKLKKAIHKINFF
jgi:hypothetical protein